MYIAVTKDEGNEAGGYFSTAYSNKKARNIKPGLVNSYGGGAGN
jgi:hypothetical protein